MAYEPNHTDNLTRIDGASSLSLATGGNIAIVDTRDGGYFLVIDQGVHVSVPIMREDIDGIRYLAGDMIMRGVEPS